MYTKTISKEISLVNFNYQFNLGDFDLKGINSNLTQGDVVNIEYFDENDIKKAVDKTLIKKSGSANDVVQTVKYLIERTDYVTGSIINVDGGRSIN